MNHDKNHWKRFRRERAAHKRQLGCTELLDRMAITSDPDTHDLDAYQPATYGLQEENFHYQH